MLQQQQPKTCVRHNCDLYTVHDERTWAERRCPELGPASWGRPWWAWWQRTRRTVPCTALRMLPTGRAQTYMSTHWNTSSAAEKWGLLAVWHLMTITIQSLHELHVLYLIIHAVTVAVANKASYNHVHTIHVHVHYKNITTCRRLTKTQQFTKQKHSRKFYKNILQSAQRELLTSLMVTPELQPA